VYGVCDVPSIFRPQKAYYMVSEGEERTLNDLYWRNWEDNVDRNWKSRLKWEGMELVRQWISLWIKNTFH